MGFFLGVFFAFWCWLTPFFPSFATHAILQQAFYEKESGLKREKACKAIVEGQKVLAKKDSIQAAKDVGIAYEMIGHPSYAKAFFLYAQKQSPRDRSLREKVQELNRKLGVPLSHFSFYSFREVLALLFLLLASFFLYLPEKKEEEFLIPKRRLLICLHLFLFFTAFCLVLYELLGKDPIAIVLEPLAISKEERFASGQEVVVADSNKAKQRYFVRNGLSLVEVPASLLFVLH
jgi:hypothetical protein